MKSLRLLTVAAMILAVTSAEAKTRPAVSPDQGARIVAAFTRDSQLQKEIENGFRHLESFVTPDGTRSIMLTSHREAKTNRLVSFAADRRNYDLVCVERYALHPQEDRIVAVSEESCFPVSNDM